MGLLKKIIKFFSSAIECPDKFAKNLLYVAPLKQNTIHLGSTLIVRKNAMAVLVVKGRVADIFIEGKHKLILAAMPEVAKLVNFDKKNKEKKPKEKFRGEIYFVNLTDFKDNFVGVEPFIIKDERLGKAKVRADGEFEFNITNAKTFIEVCLINWAYIKADVVKKKINFWVSEEVVKVLQYLNLPLLEFAENNEFISERMSAPVIKKFLSYGINISYIKITETFIPNKFAIMLKELADESRSSSLRNDYSKDTAYIPINNEREKTPKSYTYDEDEYDYVNFLVFFLFHYK